MKRPDSDAPTGAPSAEGESWAKLRAFIDREVAGCNADALEILAIAAKLDSEDDRRIATELAVERTELGKYLAQSFSVEVALAKAMMLLDAIQLPPSGSPASGPRSPQWAFNVEEDYASLWETARADLQKLCPDVNSIPNP